MENSKNSNEKYPKIRMDHTALFSGLKEAIFNRNDRRGLVIGSVADFQRHEDKFGEVLSNSEVCCDILSVKKYKVSALTVQYILKNLTL